MTRSQHDRLRAAIALITKVADELDEVLDETTGEPIAAAIAKTSTSIRQVTFPLTDALLESEASLRARVGKLPEAPTTHGDST